MIQEARNCNLQDWRIAAKHMHTSRAALNRLLDDTDTSLTPTTLANAAAALGQGVKIELVAA